MEHIGANNPTIPGDPRAERTVARIQTALAEGGSASLMQIVELIREVTYKVETISVQQLGEVVGRDLPTMSRVLGVAHTLGYNPEGVEISNLPHAIHVIGFTKIRNLAISLLLMDHATATHTTPAKRDVAAAALTAGLLAQSIERRQQPAAAEDAFVCAALRHYGWMMAAQFLPEETAEIHGLAADQPTAHAFETVLGLSPLELSRRLLSLHGRLPRGVMNGLRDVDSKHRSNASIWPDQEIPVVADFSEAMCRLMSRPGLTRESFREEATRLLEAYDGSVRLTEEELAERLVEVGGTLKTFSRMFSNRGDQCLLLERLAAFVNNREFAATRPASSRASKPQYLEAEAEDASTPLSRALATITKLDVDGPAVTAGAYRICLAAMHEEFAFEQTFLFMLDPATSGYRAWAGIGTAFAAIEGRRLLGEETRDVFSVCLNRGDDALIQDPADPKIRAFIPAWLGRLEANRPLLLLPVRNGTITAAVFCGVRSAAGEFKPSGLQARLLRSLRRKLASMPAIHPVASKAA